ncbi:hypothetical protein P3875_06755 [Myroides sp. JBRI-B21084]|uniref:hypothetical protein n=1 Tax=Myroides sp. JBRI-B21084 TaxID=3119977 RepID=UPI0026E43B1D|nr:hypothetical protein [Paenimyroides cloacae]WKW45486.1 hypothetical protein P3875_06755 [Paenimyroides cloacae]
MEIINKLQPYFLYIVGGLITTTLLFFKSYIQEKAKLKALRSENKKIVEQTEQVKSQYNRELEEIKREHQLNITKRKYQYESKKENYLKFFQLLDQFTRENNVKNQERLLPILDEFNRNYLNASSQNNKRNETNAITTMSKKIQKLTFDASQDLIKIKQETNTIRLIASDEILNKLDILNLAYDKSMEVSNKIMSSLPSLMLTNNQAQMKANQREIEISAMVINNIKDQIIELMRIELNEI